MNPLSEEKRKRRPLFRRLPAKADTLSVARDYLEEEVVEDVDQTGEGGDEGEVVDEGDPSDALIARLQAAGIAPDLIADVRKGTMRQNRFTQLRQHDAGRVRDLEAQNSVLTALVGNAQTGVRAQQKSASAVETLLAEQAEKDSNPQLTSFLNRLASAMREDIEQSVGGRVMRELEPDRRLMQGIKVAAAKQECLQRLQRVYGPGVEKFFPTVWNTVLAAAERGSSVSPDYVLHSLYPNVAFRLAMETTEKQKRSKGKVVGSRVMEGHLQTGRRQALGKGGADSGEKPLSIDEIVRGWEAQRTAAGLSTDVFTRE